MDPVEKLLAGLVNFKVKQLKPTHYKHLNYSECVAVRVGVYKFDYWRALPETIIAALNLKEVVDFDEQIGYVYAYEPQFETP